ncbi:hypothetical protein EI94DRAFT_461039 [Lactarius quietus]|nr:hypothetical protein EI94DRAFT_461039 [Lactarius quietus]
MSESIKSGQSYMITNEENGLAFDEKTILGWPHHRGKLQPSINCPPPVHDTINRDALQWILEKQGDGQWTVQSLRYRKYVGFESTPRDGTAVVGLDRPRLWDIEFLPDSEYHDNTRVKFWVRSTHLVVEYPKERSEPGPLRLWEARDGRSQVWVLEEYS